MSSRTPIRVRLVSVSYVCDWLFFWRTTCPGANVLNSSESHRSISACTTTVSHVQPTMQDISPLLPEVAIADICAPNSYPLSCSALTLWVGRQEERPACKNWVMRCCCGYLSGARCRLFACGPADATAIPKSHRLLPHLNPEFQTGLSFLVPAYPGCPGKEAVKGV